MDAAEHRTLATETLGYLSNGNMGGVDSPDARTIPTALLAVGHAILSLHEEYERELPAPVMATLESTRPQPTWAGVAVLVVVAAFLLALAWVIFQ
jgi:hypothetical protein